MKRNVYILFFITLLFASCTTVENIAYLQETDTSAKNINEGLNQTYEAKIKPKDLLSITVVSTEPEASRIYNLITPMPQNQTSMLGSSIQSQPALQSYLVDNEGNINFPVLGKIHVKDFTIKELEAFILKKLETAFSNELPIVTIRIVNFSVSVLGEVNVPGRIQTVNERLTIFEALALANDMTIYGKRDNVKVMRENSDGSKSFYTLNLNNKNVIYSPGFYLDQNDVVYVEPNNARANSSKYGAAESFRISSLSVLISLATMAVTIFSVTR